MGLESGTLISQLVPSNPVSDDGLSQADDHIRLIKAVLVNVFPGVGGQGFATPITSTEAELNLMHGRTTNDFFASGTRMLFAQAAAPTGWVQDTSDAANNRMLRVINSAGGGTGGSHDPSLMNVVPAHTHNFVSGYASADHTHYDSGHSHVEQLYGQPTGEGNGIPQCAQSTSTGVSPTSVGYAILTGTSASHQHAGGTDNGSSQVNWTPRYNNCIICQKS